MNNLKRVGLATGVLTDNEIDYIDTQVTKTVYPLLVGRTLMPTRILPHAGFKNYTYFTENDMSQANISMTGEEQSMDRVDLNETEVKIPIISKNYHLNWRDVLMRRNNGEDLNTQNAQNAARQIAEEEDKLILTGEYTGWPALGIEGMATATGRNTTGGGDWSANFITYVAAAKALLRADGYFGPYKLILNSTWYGQLEALVGTTDRFGFQVLGDLLGGEQNIVVSDSLYTAAGGTDNALVVSNEPGNFELLVGQDISNYLAQLPTMNYQGKVWEAVAPVIKRPESICEITSLT